MALIPPEKASDAFVHLKDNSPDYDLENFLDNVLETWIENPNFPINMWNHYNNLENTRTNNHVEGFHLKLDTIIQKKKPHIWRFIEEVQKLDTTYSLNYIRIENGNYRGNTRSKKDIEPLYNSTKM